MSSGPPAYFNDNGPGHNSRPSADVVATIRTNLNPQLQELVNLFHRRTNNLAYNGTGCTEDTKKGHDRNLLKELKEIIVTTDPTPEICELPTGAARNTKILKAIDKMTDAFKEEKKARELQQEAIQNMAQDLKEAVKAAYEEKALDNGHLTFDNVSSILDAKLNSFVEDTQDTINKAMDEFKRSIQVKAGDKQRE